MKLLTLTTYRIDLPRHGGQIRVNALHRVLRAQGWTTRHMAVHVPAEGDPVDGADHLFPLDAAYHRHLERIEGRTDIDAADFLVRDAGRFEAACAVIDGYDPDVIWLEHPWLWPFVKAYRAAHPGSRARIVYGSANVETQLVEAVTRGLSKGARERIRERVRAMEDELAGACDGIVACSPGDLLHFQSYGKPSVLAANGVWPKAQRSDTELWARRTARFGTALFVASGHPPNATGFVTMLGNSLAYLAPDERIVVVGSVMRLLEAPGYWREHRGFNLSRILDAGVLDEGGLATLLDLAGGVILPITEGGGTNLKTAEALYNRRPIVATSAAMRGFERFADFPGVTVRDEPQAFQAALKALLAERDRPALTYMPEQERELETLLWPATLCAVAPFLDALAAQARTRSLPAPKTSAQPAAAMETWSQHRLRPLLARGWHEFEPGGAWSRERVAVLRLRFPGAGPGPIHLRAHVEVFNPHKRSVEIEIFTPNGLQATHSFGGKDRKRAMAIRIDEIDRDADDMTEIYFRSSALFSPISSRNGGDARLLGFRITAIDVAREELPGTRASAMRGLWAGTIGPLLDRLR
ncbi:hypothetical protein [Methylobacterium dankookense]|uniref:Glycosyltransferase subfamily 4-like N-terminal domain-containing protein n=1 Tax=Methylobacterium dankookense TaxID=560405 RepID=A0A564FRU0_9HYPH|nr:hypothetical protein [Methylobacterium dankookense]GJD58558.1 hypothetical protein IFDJLNFL_4479 [Methylobacterium dankookense]VUF10899.1 hypothetical protein MTDSW087_00571 [Methylobacterium dankookense]